MFFLCLSFVATNRNQQHKSTYIFGKEEKGKEHVKDRYTLIFQWKSSHIIISLQCRHLYNEIPH